MHIDKSALERKYSFKKKNSLARGNSACKLKHDYARQTISKVALLTHNFSHCNRRLIKSRSARLTLAIKSTKLLIGDTRFFSLIFTARIFRSETTVSVSDESKQERANRKFRV